MDFKNLCQKIDVDSIRAKIPPLPAIPAMPQMKLPKSITKLKSRKIFRSSREDVSGVTSKQTQKHQQQHQMVQQHSAIPMRSEFITRTPTRISTVSSLVHHHQTVMHIEECTYRSADSIDDDYPSPRQFQHGVRGLQPISPLRTSINSINDVGASTTNNPKLSLSEKLQKGYRDLSAFKFKHIFAKRTVVRKDTIRVDHYVQRFQEDRQLDVEEAEHRDAEIADNYRFKFKISRQNTGHTNSISSNESLTADGEQSTRKAGKSVNEQSGDESGLESTPPKPKRGIAATRFARVRNPPLRQSASEESSETIAAICKEEVHTPSALWSIKENRTPVEASPIANDTPSSKVKGYKERLRRLTSYASSHDESDNETAPEGSKTMGMLSKLRGIGKPSTANESETTSYDRKRKAALTPQQSEERPDQKVTATTTGGENPLITIKQNFKRIQKSIKRQSGSTDESDDEDGTKQTNRKRPTKTEKLTARLRRFKSHDSIEGETTKDEANKSPVRAAIASKLQNLKKSLKKKPVNENVNNTGDEASPEKRKRSGSLMQKLNYIRSRKQPNSTEDLDVDDEEAGIASTSSGAKDGATRKGKNFEEKFENVRQRTLKKMNDKMQQMKFFHKSQENMGKDAETKKNDEDEDETEHSVSKIANVPPAISRRGLQDNKQCYHDCNNVDDEQEDSDGIEEIANIEKEYAQRARTSWTTKPILSDSMESDTDVEFPRVLIHQDNSDLFESTLIIAVTRPTPSPSSISPKITEITVAEATKRTPTPTPPKPKPKPKPVEWIPNSEIISNFLEMTPPSKRKLSSESQASASRAILGHTRRLSIDSNSDSDSWIPETIRNKQIEHKELIRRTSTAGLNSIVENEENAWKVHSMYPDEKLYKAKSIDIFERNTQKGGVGAAFEDFDDELKNAPVVKIDKNNKETIIANAPDHDYTSRVTKILTECIQEEEKESAMATENQLRQIGNSIESLIANFDENDEIESDDEDDTDDDRPPSAAPSPPPLPLRRTSMRMSTKPTGENVNRESQQPQAVINGLNLLPEDALPVVPPPLPKSKPPLPPIVKPPPRIPERTASMNRPSKPLVKTSSLRLTFEEQVQPTDIGKVNKLISRFEQPQSKIRERPRVIARRIIQDDSEEYSDEDADDAIEAKEDAQNEVRRYAHKDRDVTPTPTNTPRMNSFNTDESDENTGTKVPIKSTRGNNIIDGNHNRQRIIPVVITTEANNTIDAENNIVTTQDLLDEYEQQKSSSTTTTTSTTTNLVRNFSFSRPNSEYGSPLEYPSSLIGSTESTPIADRKLQELRVARRNRRSMTRDDDNFYSFDSDEENSYYSISSSGSNRYIVEL